MPRIAPNRRERFQCLALSLGCVRAVDLLNHKNHPLTHTLYGFPPAFPRNTARPLPLLRKPSPLLFLPDA